ncbi:MAG: hypothetical protein M3680_08010 [Myxococcota bacterium]|nr:hypothetical protein [Myxococcota bacterium]
MKRQVRAAVRWFVRGGMPRWLVTAALVVIVGMYAANDDMGGAPAAPRGDGVYRPVLARGDGHMMFLIARSTAFDLDWNFDNDLGRYGDPWNQPVGPGGHKVIPQPLGPPLVWTPLLWAAQGLATVGNWFGAEIPTHGYTLWHQRLVFLSSALAACFAILLGIRISRVAIGGGRWAPAYAGVAVLLGTSLTYYATYMPSYGHALDALTSATFLAYWVVTIGRVDVRRWVILGGLLGLAMLVRMQELGLGVVVALEIAVAVVRQLRARAPREAARLVIGGAAVLAIAGLVFIPQLLYWKVVYGGFFAVPHVGAYTRLSSPMILELLFSARNGWFSTHPLAYAGVIGLWFVPRPSRLIAAGLLLAVAVQVYLGSTIFDYWGMASYGSRRLCNMTLPIVVGLAALIWRCGRLAARVRRVPRPIWHVVALAILTPFVAWNLWRVRDYQAGKAAPEGLIPTCCEHLPRGFARPLTAVFRQIGNPFQFPANLLFALRHGVEIQRWDRAVGTYPVMPPLNLIFDDDLAGQSGRWRLGFPDTERYLIGTWSPSQAADRRFRWTLEPTVRALVPNLLPKARTVTVWLSPGGAAKPVTLRWNDRVAYAGVLAPGWTPVAFDLDDTDVGEDELAITTELGPVVPWAGAPGPVPTTPVGVAVHSVDIVIR